MENINACYDEISMFFKDHENLFFKNLFLSLDLITIGNFALKLQVDLKLHKNLKEKFFEPLCEVWERYRFFAEKTTAKPLKC